MIHLEDLLSKIEAAMNRAMERESADGGTERDEGHYNGLSEAHEIVEKYIENKEYL